MRQIDSEPRARFLFTTGSISDLIVFNKQLQRKGQAHTLSTVTLTGQKILERWSEYPSRVWLAKDPVSGETRAGLMATQQPDGTVYGLWLLADDEYSHLLPGAALLEQAKTLCEKIILNAYPFYYTEDNYSELQAEVDKLKRYYTNLGFQPLEPENPNSTLMVWKKPTSEPTEA